MMSQGCEKQRMSHLAQTRENAEGNAWGKRQEGKCYV